MPSDVQMESPMNLATVKRLFKDVEGEARTENAICDEESIAFGVMYFPRTRVQRTDQINCDTRVLREPIGDDGFICHFIDAGAAPLNPV